MRHLFFEPRDLSLTGLFVAGHQAGFSNLQVGELSGANAITDFCANGGTCDTTLGLCK